MRPLGVVLLSVLLVMVSLVAGFAAGSWATQMRADAQADNILRNVGIVVMGNEPYVVAADGKRKYVWPEGMRMPLGVYSLYEQAGEPIHLGQEPPVPIACISPGYDLDVFIVLFSNWHREKLTRTQLEKLLGIKGVNLENYDLRGFYKGPRAS